MNSARRITDELEKPDLDDRSYRVIELSNKLEALLVHDAQTDKASASLNVNVGNFSDEEDMPGMAHAVEHLLFMGTEKVRYQSSRGGFRFHHADCDIVSGRKRIQLVPFLKCWSFQRLHSCNSDELFLRMCRPARIK
jgi:predicted Zn-dependent peptidase